MEAADFSVVKQYFSSASSGDIEKLKHYRELLPDLNIRNDDGWTALMYGARNGQTEVIEYLLREGARTDLLTKTGLTALSIAEFWNFSSIVDLLGRTEATDRKVHPSKHSVVNYMCGGKHNRLHLFRKDPAWIEGALEKGSCIGFVNLDPLLLPELQYSDQQRNGFAAFKWLKFKYSDVMNKMTKPHLYIFLGSLAKEGKDEQEQAIFAVPLPQHFDVAELNLSAQVVPVRKGLLQLDPQDACFGAQARSLLAWHDRHQFCSACGASSVVEQAGHSRKCSREDCRSHSGTCQTRFPRIDPSVIMLVISPCLSKILLGQGQRFPGKYYSCLAGFVEMGESIEEAVRRETEEEAGVDVDRVIYHSSQPWPMPSSLMIGCLAYATTTAIKVDPTELVDARWFTRSEIIQALNGTHSEKIRIPPEQAIAYSLIAHWLQNFSKI